MSNQTPQDYGYDHEAAQAAYAVCCGEDSLPLSED